MREYVWIYDEKVYGELLHYGAYYSLVRYEFGGWEFEEWLNNDDFEFREEHAIEYEQE